MPTHPALVATLGRTLTDARFGTAASLYSYSPRNPSVSCPFQWWALSSVGLRVLAAPQLTQCGKHIHSVTALASPALCEAR
jgi:hypothetical protein